MVLEERFLPDRQMTYLQKNAQHSSRYRNYHEHLPVFLHNRPPVIVKHMMARMTTAEDYSKDYIACGSEPSIFHVVSQSYSGTRYRVDLNEPSCTCRDFLTTGLLCKHFFAIFAEVDGCSFEMLPESYRDGPLLTLDGQDVTPAARMSTEAGSPQTGIDDDDDITEDPPTRDQRGMEIMRHDFTSKLRRCGDGIYNCHNQATV